MTPVLEKAFRVSGVPEKLLPLFALSHDLRWTWRADVRALFSSLDPDAWRRARGNPVRFFREVPAERLWRAADDAVYQEELHAVADGSQRKTPGAPHPSAGSGGWGEKIAYFSAEFGLTRSCDLCRRPGNSGRGPSEVLERPRRALSGSAFLSEGTSSGRRRRGKRRKPIPCSSPRTAAVDREPHDGSPPVVSVDLAGRSVHLLIRSPGRPRPLLLLDSSLRERASRPESGASTGAATRCGSSRKSFAGGSRALDKLGLSPTIRHINEGHAAFVSLEKIRRLVQEEHLTFAEAREVATTGNIFTTHTPVPAGIDVFTPELLWKYFGAYVAELGISFDEFFDLGREVGDQSRELFSMAVLAMRLSTHQNAVSKLHSGVSRRLWRANPRPPAVGGPDRRSPTRARATDGPISWRRVRLQPDYVDRAALWQGRFASARCRVRREKLAAEKRARGRRKDRAAATLIRQP